MTITQPSLLTPHNDPQLAENATRLRERAKSRNTITAYQHAWEAFVDFCRFQKRVTKAIPARPLHVSEYLGWLYREKGASRRTIGIHKAAIRHYHHEAGHVDPCKAKPVLDTWSGIIRDDDERRYAEGSTPVTVHALQSVVETVINAIDDQHAALGINATRSHDLQAARDRALILLTSSTGYITTAEAQSIRVQNYVNVEAGIRLRVQRSPDNPTKFRDAFIHRGRNRYCPIEAMARWIREAELEPGTPLFRPIDAWGHIGETVLTTRNMNAIVKDRAAKAKIDEHLQPLISMRSWRGGAIQQAAYNGASTDDILEAAHLSPDSRPIIDTTVSNVRRLRHAGHAAPPLIEIK